jgi:heme/copper-type cytochrome/quinol oxidase subunit 2
MAFRPSRRLSAGFVLVAAIVLGWVTPPRTQEARQRSFTVSARRYAFSPAAIEVNQDDLVRITFTTEDIPHSFTVDKYRIAKRVEPGKSVVFEFRADQPGRFPIYCNLAIDEKCKDMRGELIVKPDSKK